MFSCGSWLLDTLGFGVNRNYNKTQNDDDEDNDDDIDKDERVVKSIEEMENYCKPLIFLKFWGQTSSDEV